MLKKITIWSLALLILTACTETPPEPVTVAPTPSPTVPAGEPAAHLKSFRPPTVFRRMKELLWRDVFLPLPFFRFDVVHTRQSAAAEIDLVKGSHLTLGENTLVVIDGDSITRSLASQAPDRAVMQKGKVRGSTDGELWLLTPAAIFRLRQPKGERLADANARLEIEPRRQNVEVEVLKGSGTLFRTASPGSKKITEAIPLIAGKVYSLPAPPVSESFGAEESSVEWPNGRELDAIADAAARKLERATLTVLSPQDRAAIDDDEIEINLKITGTRAQTLRINGKKSAFTLGKSLKARVPLSLGPNNVVLELDEDGGKTVVKRLLVIRRK